MSSWTRVVRRGSKPAAVLLTAGAIAALTACGTTSVLDLEVGDCLSGATGDQVGSVNVVDCSQPHQNEIYSLPQVPDGAFPGEQALAGQAEQVCADPAFQSYVGKPYEQSEIYFTHLVPSTDTWADGDREIVCMLRNEDGSDITGSLRNANR